MLQYLIHDFLSGFNLPKCRTSGARGIHLNSLKSEIRPRKGYFLGTDRPGMIALRCDIAGWTWVLYNDLTTGLMGSSRSLPLAYEEAIRQYLIV